MWISEKKHKEALREQRQDHRIADMEDKIWKLEDDVRDLQNQVVALKTQAGKK